MCIFFNRKCSPQNVLRLMIFLSASSTWVGWRPFPGTWTTFPPSTRPSNRSSAPVPKSPPTGPSTHPSPRRNTSASSPRNSCPISVPSTTGTSSCLATPAVPQLLSTAYLEIYWAQKPTNYSPTFS